MGLTDLQMRAARHAALGDPARLAIVDELARSDRSPAELRRFLGIESNLLSHHLDVLQSVGMIRRSRSSGDGRRRYVRLVGAALGVSAPQRPRPPDGALFVCTRNSARSQLAAGLWRIMAQTTADSAGTHPAERVHPGAVAAARRAGFDLSEAQPRQLVRGDGLPSLVVTVCDQAHEELAAVEDWLHWSIPDPVVDGSRAAFDATVAALHDRIESLLRASPVAS